MKFNKLAKRDIPKLSPNMPEEICNMKVFFMWNDHKNWWCNGKMRFSHQMMCNLKMRGERRRHVKWGEQKLGLDIGRDEKQELPQAMRNYILPRSVFFLIFVLLFFNLTFCFISYFERLKYQVKNYAANIENSEKILQEMSITVQLPK